MFPEVLRRRRGAGGGNDIGVSACGYNHLDAELVAKTRGTYIWVHDRATGVNFKAFSAGGPCINLFALEDIPVRMQEAVGNECLIHAAHEECWYPDYFAYQPDSRDKLMSACKVVYDAGYDYFFIEDKIDW